MAAANTYDNAWMKSRTGVNDEKYCRQIVQLLSEPSPRKTLRWAPKKPHAHAAVARMGPKSGQRTREATNRFSSTSGGSYTGRLSAKVSTPTSGSGVSFTASSL